MKTLNLVLFAAFLAGTSAACGGGESPPANAPTHSMDMNMGDGGMAMPGMDHSKMAMDGGAPSKK